MQCDGIYNYDIINSELINAIEFEEQIARNKMGSQDPSSGIAI